MSLRARVKVCGNSEKVESQTSTGDSIQVSSIPIGQSFLAAPYANSFDAALNCAVCVAPALRRVAHRAPVRSVHTLPSSGYAVAAAPCLNHPRYGAEFTHIRAPELQRHARLNSPICTGERNALAVASQGPASPYELSWGLAPGGMRREHSSVSSRKSCTPGDRFLITKSSHPSSRPRGMNIASYRRACTAESGRAWTRPAQASADGRAARGFSNYLSFWFSQSYGFFLSKISHNFLRGSELQVSRATFRISLLTGKPEPARASEESREVVTARGWGVIQCVYSFKRRPGARFNWFPDGHNESFSHSIYINSDRLPGIVQMRQRDIPEVRHTPQARHLEFGTFKQVRHTVGASLDYPIRHFKCGGCATSLASESAKAVEAQPLGEI
ncbi:hypothetical protein B0H14DRAFT_2635616 [Mycena olivaceomarginata]|nr:hypothetical protein B0H14DRAFT_2635616 [Mycena olivaceomarginata]